MFDNILKKIFDTDPTEDMRFGENAGSFDYSDTLSDEILKMRNVQLLDEDVWELFVSFFRNTGSDDLTLSWKGEFWGKMMRGACFIYRTSPEPDDELYSVLENSVLDMMSAADANGRISTYSLSCEFKGWDLWCRKYVMLGLIYFHDICRSESIREDIVRTLCAHADYIIDKIGPDSGKLELPACSSNWDGLNSSSILEPFVLLFKITKEPRYLEYSEYIASFGGTLHENLIDLALENKTPISSFSQPKAYEMISFFDGVAELSKVTANSDMREAVINFADRLLEEETTVIGCLGTATECLNHSSVMQSDGSYAPLEEFKGKKYNIMLETCVTVTWMKFMWQLWRMTGDAKYIDALEISVYNAMSAALKTDPDPVENCGVVLPVHSYNPLRNAVRSELLAGQQPLTDSALYGCCECISSAGFALDTLASVGHDNDGTVYLNLFRNGTVRLSDITFLVKTDYPLSGKISVSVISAEDKMLAVRIPAFVKKAEVTFKGDSYYEKPGYAEFKVNSGDEIEIDIPMEIRYLSPDDAADVPTGRDDYYAVMRGPVVYALDFTDESEPLVPFDTDTEPEISDVSSSPVPCRLAVSVPLKDGGSALLMDYRSAGQIKGHKVSAWIRQK